MVRQGEEEAAMATLASAVSPGHFVNEPVPVGGGSPATASPGYPTLARPRPQRRLLGCRWLAAVVACLSRWTCLSDVWQLVRVLTLAYPAVSPASSGPSSDLVQAARRRGLDAVSSPLGWWVLVVLPNGQVAQITTLEAGRYALALDGLSPQTFGSLDAALEAALRMGTTGRR